MVNDGYKHCRIAPIDAEKFSSLKAGLLTHGDVPLDNNRCENAIRPFVVGRKGWLFSDTVKGAVASANLYSIVETAKANGVEPHAYLSFLFERLPHAKKVEDFEALLPWNANIPARL